MTEPWLGLPHLLLALVLRRITDLWVALIGAVLLGGYFIGLAVHKGHPLKLTRAA
jgi:hypothetical protein